MSLLADTSVWSLAWRRDVEQSAAEVLALRHALLGADQVFTTGLLFQELLQGFDGPKHRSQLVENCRAAAKHVASTHGAPAEARPGKPACTAWDGRDHQMCAMATTRLFRNGHSQAVRIPADLAYERVDLELDRRADHGAQPGGDRPPRSA